MRQTMSEIKYPHLLVSLMKSIISIKNLE